MLKKKTMKIVLVLACIMTLIMPYTSVVLAATTKVTHQDSTVSIQAIKPYEGGEESSGTLADEDSEYYDQNIYEYEVADPTYDDESSTTNPGTFYVRRILRMDGETPDYRNVFYCINAEKSFPDDGAIEYTNVIEDFSDTTQLTVKSLHLGTSYAENPDLWNRNHKALMWVFNNMYLPESTSGEGLTDEQVQELIAEQKNAFIAKAFADYGAKDEGELKSVKTLLTDDDIDVVQQLVIWYFTNNDSAKYTAETLPAIQLTDVLTRESGAYGQLEGTIEDRQKMADHLYKYLINSAKNASNEEVTYPSFAETNAIVNYENSEYFVIGPVKVNSGTASAEDYTIKLVDQNDDEIPTNEYKLFVNGNETTAKIDTIFDTEYYIYIPTTNKTITELNIVMSYSKTETTSSVWESTEDVENDQPVYQPVTLITRDVKKFSDELPFEIERKTADLALRKYIAKINGNNIANVPVVDLQKLKSGESQTAEYKHSKEPIVVSTGDTILYEIRVYNEADIDAKGTIILDTLPKGLELVENSEINKTYNWKLVREGTHANVYSSNYLENTTIEAFDIQSLEILNSAYVQIECKVTTDATVSAVLTNIAELAADGIEDRDSAPSNHDYTQQDYDASNYTGNNTNKDELDDTNYYYMGREDDDDFVKVRVEGKTFDLSLQKFVSKVNGKVLDRSREPAVNVTPLKQETSTDAEYTTVKTPVTVEPGDIVTYTIRVYNEGELPGYAEIVTDYLPEGLGYLNGYKLNEDNYWSISKDNDANVLGEPLSLSEIKNGTKNLAVSDFKDCNSLSDVIVTKGKVKLTSNRLASSELDNKNLIDGFDKDTDSYLEYKDIQIACIVLAEEVSNNNLKNIAEISKEADEEREEIKDLDSTPDTVNPEDYPGPDKNDDDNDYENLTIEEPAKFDLSLQKFITGINGSKVETREPKVTGSKGKFTIKSNNTTPLKVENGDVITYTIRVYNEGEAAGYAAEISDNIPVGLEFLSENETNKEYGWKAYDKNGNVTTDLSQAVTVKTDYLSKEKSAERDEDCLIDPCTPSSTTLDYRDVQLVFKVDESKLQGTDKAKRTIKNTAEITNDQDQDGNQVDDIDSVPNNKKDGEDDIDTEEIYVGYFDLSLKKDLVKIIVTEDGTTREITVSPNDGLQKVEIHRKKINSTTVKFVYKITVTNEGEIEGYATEIKDYIPNGLEYVEEDNAQWNKGNDNTITTKALEKTLLKPGQSAEVQVTLKWINGENNFDAKLNVAEISEDKNDSNTPDVDSTPDNKKSGEDDIDDAEVVLTISTGTGSTYMALVLVIAIIMTTGITLIKKYVLI